MTLFVHSCGMLAKGMFCIEYAVEQLLKKGE